MYSQVLKVNIQPGKMDEGIAIFKDSVAPTIHGWSGLQSGRLRWTPLLRQHEG